MADRTLDMELIRQLAELLDKTSLTEIEVEDEGVRIRVARTAATVTAPAPAVIHHAAALPVAPPDAPAPAETGASAPATPVDAVKSPMVGTVYLSGEPGAKPFVAPGQRVAAGDTLLIIEAMKVLNPITAPSAGTVRAVLVANGQPVEFDQPLVVLD
ncbi:acetyl-CoA carboxylase biotin carboxyl carrier protein [uncultured Sphingomonas sp.]|uniref:acetyl-CoA carboxylase biotin carboxyl carrier protein n=1 Tax=uncultured Sphingomonas sp. TaxID=158754 RepID=UPI0035CBAEFD